MIMKLRILFLTALMVLAMKGNAQQAYVGGDVSVLLKYEEQNAEYLDTIGNPIPDLLVYLKEQGWNAMRVRLFADPSTSEDRAVCQDLDYVKRLGQRIKAAGLYFMLDIHYSDSWADPGQQTAPSEWSAYTWLPEQSFYAYTKSVLTELKQAGAEPDLIQTGNEISFGLHWGFLNEGEYVDYGNLSGQVYANSNWTAYQDTNWDNLAKYLKAAGEACREVCPKAKIILHTEQCANNPTLDVAFFKRVEAYDIDYDIIGVSYYPYFKGPLSSLDNGLTRLENNFPGRQIQLVETGYPSKWPVPGGSSKYYEYSLTPEGQRLYTADLIAMLKKHAQVYGLFWWYPEANAYGCTGTLAEGWYNAGLFNNETGRALPAIYELNAFLEGRTAIHGVPIGNSAGKACYTLQGARLTSLPARKGVYIVDGRKVIVR